ncbi:REP element-mobilizing transposase RayT [Cyclobacterium lianum]|uniref:REP element-mobilizing transposase RayT n=1 Tax=Cyclobacterium lianum TaxID=388280 RepID=A0A1M7NT25_9BACT|nr:transposase [Cyclobacterium lianum]SHN07175.1 REP element-mobilizing transposase RayT [Cyclobacterium lianum]
MAFAYTIKNQESLHYVTFTVHQWVDIFTRKIYADILIDSINYCQQTKGLKVYAWVIMSNHCHFILSSDKVPLADIIRDFKKFTAKKIIEQVKESKEESRKSWLMWLLHKDEHIWFWTEGYHGIEISSEKLLKSKINYIHQNPVKAGIVEKEEEYLNSSCGEFYGIRKSRISLAAY